MKKIKALLISLLCVAVILSPFITVFATALTLPPVFDGSFVGVLDEKVSRLDSIEEEKIIVIGGSSVAFGINSELIEKYTEMPVVNFGLYASLGTKLMLDLSKKSVKDGDVVVIAPEMDAQTLSLYFNADSTLEAMDGSFGLLSRVSFEDIFKIIASSWDFAAKKLEYRESGAPEITGVYSAESFNEYLDVDYVREHNIMHTYYDENLKINLSPDIVSDDFIDYLNDYIAFCKRKGASVYFSWCPMNSLAVTNESGESIRDFQNFMEENIDAQFISDIADYILPPEYFYDTNFHVNDAGMLRHSVNLTKDILFELGIPRLVEAPDGVEIPGLVTVPKPTLPLVDVRYFDYDENEIYFNYEKRADGSYTITGLSELGKTKSTLTLPLGAESFMVSGISEGAFMNSNLEELIIPKGTNLKILMNGCFKGASKLSRLVIYHENEEDILPPYDFLGVADGFTVFIPKDSDYDSGYYWGERGLRFERMEK
ncbi:MAG: hypothetical protein IJW38_02685 [Clostridia bacterium]|nr:hypothetical protein [Clostridia bacterium]